MPSASRFLILACGVVLVTGLLSGCGSTGQAPTPDASSAPLPTWGPVLRRHERFGADGTNVDVAAAGSSDRAAVRTWVGAIRAPLQDPRLPRSS